MSDNAPIETLDSDLAKVEQDAAALVAPTPAGVTADEIDQWFAENFRNSIVSQRTDVYNFVYGAVQKLKALAGAKASA